MEYRAANVALGNNHMDPGGCVICHGGNPTAADKVDAHQGAPEALADVGGPERFYPDPGSVWIANRTCGQCHTGYAERLIKALMTTEAGKLQGNLWSWAVQHDRKARWGAAAEAECEQYVTGFTDAYVMFAKAGRDENVCLPADNRPDELRWAFMKWAHRSQATSSSSFCPALAR